MLRPNKTAKIQDGRIDMRTIAIFMIGVLLAGCVTTQATRLGDGPIFPAVPADKVVIYRNADQVRKDYVEVALITASGDYSYTDEEQMYKKMRERAGAMGANGLILDSVTEPTTGAKVANFLLGTAAQRKGKVVAIRVVEESSSTLSAVH
jgi:hypothetical protein